MKTKVIIFLIIVVLLIGGGIVIHNLTKDKIHEIPEGTIGNTGGNINNGGYFCEYNGKVYFSNPYDGGAIYSMNPDESEITKLFKQSGRFINAADDHLFFYMYENRQGSDLGSVIRSTGIYRASIDGKHILGLKRGVMDTMLLLGNKIFYQNYDKDKGFSMYVISPDGENDEEIADMNRNPATGYGDKIYFGGIVDDHNLYVMNTNDYSAVKLENGDFWNPIYADGYLFYQCPSEDYSLYRYNITTGENICITRDRTESFNAGSGYVFYTVSAKKGACLKRIEYDGNGEVTLDVGNFMNLSLTSENLYYQEFESGKLKHVAIYSGMPSEFEGALQAVWDVF